MCVYIFIYVFFIRNRNDLNLICMKKKKVNLTRLSIQPWIQDLDALSIVYLFLSHVIRFVKLVINYLL